MLIIESNNKIDDNKVSSELSALKKLNDLFLTQKDILLKHFNIGLMEISDDKDYILQLNKFLEEFNDLFSKINTSITNINELIIKIDTINKTENTQELQNQINSYNELYIKNYPGLIDCIIYITNFVEELFITPSYEKSIEHRKSIFSAATAYNEKQAKIHSRNENKSKERNKILDEFLQNENEEAGNSKIENIPEVKEEASTKPEKKEEQVIDIPVIEATLGPIQPDEKPIIRPPRPNPGYKTSQEKPLIDKEPIPSEERTKNAVQNELNRIYEEDEVDTTKSSDTNNKQDEEKIESDEHANIDISHTNEEIDKFVSNVDIPEVIPEPVIAASTIEPEIPTKIKSKKKKAKDIKKKKEAKPSIPQRVTKLPLQDNDTLIISEKSGYVYLPFKVSDLNSEYIEKKNKYSGLVDLVNKEYTIPIGRYKNSVTSRFKEAYLLMTNKEKSSALSGLELGLELAFNYSLHPAIISACKNLDELDEYLDALESKDLSQFNSFKVSFELMPKK